MFLLHALDKRIGDLTNQLIALKSVGYINEKAAHYTNIREELLEVTKQRKDFLEAWVETFPRRHT